MIPEQGGPAEVLDGLGVQPLPAPAQVELPSGLPVLPELPDLPALPVIPTIDPTLLLKPITDLLGVFGTGLLGGGAGGNPAVAHQQIAQLLESGVGVLLNAASSLDGGWLGQAATAAITAATRTAGESGAVAAQGAGMSVDLQAAAAVVASGALQLQGVVAKTAGLLSAALPAIATPPGQIAALAIAAEGLAEGLAVVTATRAQLVAPTASMAANGTPVPVTGLPTGDAFGTVSQLLESALPLVQAGAQLATSLLSGTGLTTGGSSTSTDGADGADGATITPSGVAPAAAACSATCDKTTPTVSTAKPGGDAPTMTPASVSGAGAASVSGPGAAAATGAGAGVTIAAPTPSPLADCPTTTNAATVSATTSGGAGPQAATVGATTALPMAPVAGAVRASDVDRPMTAVPAAAAPAPAAESEWLTAMTAESLDFDVALALGLGDPDLAGSA